MGEGRLSPAVMNRRNNNGPAAAPTPGRSLAQPDRTIDRLTERPRRTVSAQRTVDRSKQLLAHPGFEQQEELVELGEEQLLFVQRA
jgi:hypothetical protein